MMFLTVPEWWLGDEKQRDLHYFVLGEDQFRRASGSGQVRGQVAGIDDPVLAVQLRSSDLLLYGG